MVCVSACISSERRQSRGRFQLTGSSNKDESPYRNRHKIVVLSPGQFNARLCTRLVTAVSTHIIAFILAELAVFAIDTGPVVRKNRMKQSPTDHVQACRVSASSASRTGNHELLFILFVGQICPATKRAERFTLRLNQDHRARGFVLAFWR